MSTWLCSIRTRAIQFSLLFSSVLALVGIAACDVPHYEDEVHSRQESPVVYGDDDRRDWWEVDDPALQQLTRQSIVALMSLGSFDRSDPDNWRVNGTPLGESRNLCDGERYADQLAAAGCSGTLIGPDLVLTAGHCVGRDSCDGTVLVFDFFERTDGVLETISASDAYPCADVVAWANSGGLDFAVLRLDRPVDATRRPVPMRLPDSPLAVGEPLYVIGFGSGLPAKIDDGGVVTDPRPATLDYFQASLDTFGGNSGSGVFNQELELVGILVRGLTDYVSDGDCTRVNVVPEEGLTGGEDITYGARAREAFCATGAVSDLLCPTGASMQCGACFTDADCQGDLVCATFPSLTGARICAEACGRDNPCASGFTCREGACEPSSTLACDGNSVARINQCGRVLETTDVCTATELCRDATCVARPQGDVCASAVPLELAPGILRDVSMVGFSADYAGTCAGNGVDRVYRFSLAVRSQLVIEATGFDTVLHLRSDDCLSQDAEAACNDDSNPPGSYGSRLDVVLDPGEWFLFVDAYDDTIGVAALSWTLTPLCSDSCTVGDAFCDGVLPRSCVRDLASGCSYFADAAPCSSGRVCEAGTCVAPPPEPDVVDGADTASDASTVDVDVHTDVTVTDDATAQDAGTTGDSGGVEDTSSGFDAVDPLPDGSVPADTSAQDTTDDVEGNDSNSESDTNTVLDTTLPPLPDVTVDGSGGGAQPVDPETPESGSVGGCSTAPSPLPIQNAALFVALGAFFTARRVRQRQSQSA
jgi:V8-like Glu-specific endopeptidase